MDPIPLENSEQLQGLWRSDDGDELTLAPSRGGILVGLYRVADPTPGDQQAVTGHVRGGCLAFSTPLPQGPGVVGWSGTFRRDREGPRLDLDRIVVRSGGDPEVAVSETYRRVESGADQTGPLRLQETPPPSIPETKNA
ncbi:MAG: hypothetical protein HKO53_18015 [Gemmatimonadetes bacterium]|nr:hypothetical protein [Gemmatimonadota bacterium]